MKVDIDMLTDTAVTGTLDLTFEDGTTATGSFDVAICELSEDEGLPCL